MRLTIVLVLVLFSLGETFSQNTDAELFFNDGTSIEGYGELYKMDKIKFRISRDVEPDVWTNLMVKKVIFYGFEISAQFEYVTLKPNEDPKLLEVLVNEETKLYSDVTTFTFYSNNGFNNGTPTSVSKQQFSTTKIYAQKETDEFPISLTGNFRKKAKEYFSDCEILVKKINSGEFRKSTAKDMVYYYNDYCGE